MWPRALFKVELISTLLEAVLEALYCMVLPCVNTPASWKCSSRPVLIRLKQTTILLRRYTLLPESVNPR